MRSLLLFLSDGIHHKSGNVSAWQENGGNAHAPRPHYLTLSILLNLVLEPRRPDYFYRINLLEYKHTRILHTFITISYVLRSSDTRTHLYSRVIFNQQNVVTTF